jgi:hypothetical protein
MSANTQSPHREKELPEQGKLCLDTAVMLLVDYLLAVSDQTSTQFTPFRII